MKSRFACTSLSTLVICAEGGPAIGAGHVMRCLALAQAWKKIRGPVIFIQERKKGCLQERICAEGFCVEWLKTGEKRADGIIRIARKHRSSWVVLDGYGFEPSDHEEIRGAGFKLLIVDDYAHLRRYHADLLLNQNLYASEPRWKAKYLRVSSRSQLLLGPRFVLLRKEFQKKTRRKRANGKSPKNLLVTLGGSADPSCYEKIFQALDRVEDLELKVQVLGGCSRIHNSSIKKRTSLKIHLGMSPDIPGKMAWADVALSASGSTCWELAFMGVPTLTVILSENQIEIARSLERAGASINLSWHSSLSSKKIAGALTRIFSNSQGLRKMSRRGMQMIDENGAKRVVEQMHV